MRQRSANERSGCFFAKSGCAPQTLNEWVKKVEVDTGQRGGITTEMAEKMKALERENRELKQVNEILRKGEAIHQRRPAQDQLVHHSDRGSLGGFNRSSQQPMTGVVDAHRKTQIGELDAA